MATTSSPIAPVEPSREDTANLEIVPDDEPYSSPEPAFLTDTDNASSTLSLSESVLNYQYENGRRYHAYREGAYPLPNDDEEQDRLNLHHHIARLVIGGALFRCPIDLSSSARILDLGTGTGIWTIEMADQYPKAEVTGTDLSPIQPGWVPPNCFFEIHDFESEWDFTKRFDFITGRFLAGSIRDFPLLYQRIITNLKPGGWVEMLDFAERFYSDDDTVQSAKNLNDWCELLNEASENFGKKIDVARHHEQWLTDAGFKNVKEEIFKVPINPWPKHAKMKELGYFEQANMAQALESYSLALFTRSLGWSTDKLQVFLTRVRQELADRNLHIYAKYFYVYGQKEE